MGLDFCSGKVEATTERGKRIILDDVRFFVESGHTLALVGETGSGKTMTALAIMDLLPENIKANDMEISLDGQVLKNQRKVLGIDIVYIPQSGSDYLHPKKTVESQMRDALRRVKCTGNEAKTRIYELLSAVGFDSPEKIAKSYAFTLSGGMAQRVTLAMALCTNPKLVICDEATNGLDYSAKIEFVSSARSLFKTQVIVVITHDMAVASCCDELAVLCGGKLVEYGKSSSVLNEPKHPYTKALLKSTVENGMQKSLELRTKEGECPFFVRCEYASDECLNIVSEQTDGDRRWRCAK